MPWTVQSLSATCCWVIYSPQISLTCRLCSVTTHWWNDKSYVECQQTAVHILSLRCPSACYWDHVLVWMQPVEMLLPWSKPKNVSRSLCIESCNKHTFEQSEGTCTHLMGCKSPQEQLLATSVRVICSVSRQQALKLHSIVLHLSWRHEINVKCFVDSHCAVNIFVCNCVQTTLITTFHLLTSTDLLYLSGWMSCPVNYNCWWNNVDSVH